MNNLFLFVFIVAMAVVTAAMVWLIETNVQQPTAAGKKRLTIILRFLVAQVAIVSSFVLLSIQHVLQPRFLGVLGLINFVGSFLIMWVALKRAPENGQ